ncbi:IclR family transcriptional regulator [Mycolicibacterium thermoresistibile]
MTRAAGKTADTAQTLSRGLDVLKYLAASGTPLTMTEVTAGLGLNRTVVYRLVGTLVEHGMIRRTSDGRLSVGLGVLSLTENFYPSLREASMPVLERLAEDLQATAHLAVVDGNESLAICVVEPTSTTFHLAYRAGARHPLERGAVGKALSAAMRGEEGVFVTHGELTAGATGVVASIPDLPGLPAAVGVVTLTDLGWQRFEPRVAAARQELATVLAGR